MPLAANSASYVSSVARGRGKSGGPAHVKRASAPPARRAGMSGGRIPQKTMYKIV